MTCGRMDMSSWLLKRYLRRAARRVSGKRPQRSAGNRGARGLSYRVPCRSTIQMMDAELERTLRDHHLSCFSWALACCRWNRDDAQEVLQTAYLKILEGRAHPNGNPLSRAWI